MRWMTATLCALAAACASSAQADDPLDAFLSDQFTTPAGFTTTVMDAPVDLDGDGEAERLVYLAGPGWCGSGGCNLLILKTAGDTFETVTSVSVAQLPVRVLDSTTNGWRDIGVWVQGGGVQPGYEAVLAFDGESYPRNPTVEAARPSDGTAPGHTLIDRP